VETLKTLKDMPWPVEAGILALICTLVLPFGLRGARVLITVIAAAAIFYAGVTVQSHYTVLSDAQVGLTNNQPTTAAPKSNVVTPAPQAATPGLFDDLIPANNKRAAQPAPTSPSLLSPTWSKEQADDWYRRNGPSTSTGPPMDLNPR
jgi:hypothetical protein